MSCQRLFFQFVCLAPFFPQPQYSGNTHNFDRCRIYRYYTYIVIVPIYLFGWTLTKHLIWNLYIDTYKRVLFSSDIQVYICMLLRAKGKKKYI